MCMYAIGARQEVFDVVKEDTHVCMRWERGRKCLMW